MKNYRQFKPLKYNCFLLGKDTFLSPNKFGLYTNAMKTKILVLASNPSGTERLKLNPEIRSIKESHERSQKRDEFSILPEPGC